MAQISTMVKSLVSCYLILNILIQAVPGEKYRKYVKAFGGFLMIVTLLGQMPVLQKLVSQDTFSELVGQYAQSFEAASGQTEELGNLAYSSLVSAMEKEMEERLGNSDNFSGYNISAVKLSVCEDESSERYGEMEQITLFVSQSADEPARISVNRIEVGQNGVQNKNEKEMMLENVVAEELGVEPDMVSVRLR